METKLQTKRKTTTHHWYLLGFVYSSVNFLQISYPGKSPINYSHLLGTYFCWFTHSSGKLPRVAGACETASHWSSALELLHQMEMEEISPNIRSFNSAMRSCEEEEWEKAIVLFDMLRVFDLENIGKRQEGWDVWSSHNKRHPQTQTHKHTLVGWKQITEKEKGCFFFFLIFSQSWISIHLMAECQKLGPRDLGSTPMSPLIRPPKKVWHCWLVVP